MKNKVRVVLQARTSSSRLYGKVLLPISGISLVVLCWRRLKTSNLDIVVAIPKGPEDDFLAEKIKKNKIKYFRGSSKNVLERFQNYSKKLNPRISLDKLKSHLSKFTNVVDQRECFIINYKLNYE